MGCRAHFRRRDGRKGTVRGRLGTSADATGPRPAPRLASTGVELTDELSAALNAVSGKEDLARSLKKLWILADKPSYRALSTRARNYGLPLSKTTIGQLLNGNVFPRRGYLTAFLTC